ncbi:MAG: hypothetical protein HPY66_2462 [Firmicutes bacterium]|nr:hypothetical protein [Bacillota bacterium]
MKAADRLGETLQIAAGKLSGAQDANISTAISLNMILIKNTML